MKVYVLFSDADVVGVFTALVAAQATYPCGEWVKVGTVWETPDGLAIEEHDLLFGQKGAES